MELRISVTVKRAEGLDAERLLDAALREAEGYGPVVSGDNGHLSLTLSTTTTRDPFGAAFGLAAHELEVTVARVLRDAVLMPDDIQAIRLEAPAT